MMNPIPNETSSLGMLLFVIADPQDGPAAQAQMQVHKDMGKKKINPEGTIGNRLAEEFAAYEKAWRQI
jgi:hypothetical protein